MKVIQFSLTCFGAYYIATHSTSVSLLYLGIIYGLIAISVIIDFFLSRTKPIQENFTMLLRCFYEQCDFEKDAEVKVTIHKSISDTEYIQFVDYYPFGRKRGTKYLKEKGIVRKAFNSLEEEFSANFQSKDQKLEALKSEYSYTYNEAKAQVQSGELSYFCCPILDDNKIWGVIYMNAKKYETFPDQNDLASSDFARKVKFFRRCLEDEIA